MPQNEETRLPGERAAKKSRLKLLKGFVQAVLPVSRAKWKVLDRHIAALDQTTSDLLANSAKKVDTETRFATLEQMLASTQNALDSLREETRRHVGDLNKHNLMLERLLVGTAAARPPGAPDAVGKLPTPAVSVIMTTYNRALFVREAIASVVAQSFQNWELVIVDDGSADGTESIIAPFLADPRIRHVWQENGGAAAARNRGLAETHASLIANLDSDNLWYPDFLARAVDYLATEINVDLVYGALVYRSSADRREAPYGACVLWREFNREELLRGNYIDTNVMVYRRALVERYGIWDTTIKRLDDWDMILRYTVDKPAAPLNVLAAYYRECDNQRLSVVENEQSDISTIRKKLADAAAVAAMAIVDPNAARQEINTIAHA